VVLEVIIALELLAAVITADYQNVVVIFKHKFLKIQQYVLYAIRLVVSAESLLA
jgi:hypothetical protein